MHRLERIDVFDVKKLFRNVTAINLGRILWNHLGIVKRGKFSSLRCISFDVGVVKLNHIVFGYRFQCLCFINSSLEIIAMFNYFLPVSFFIYLFLFLFIFILFLFFIFYFIFLFFFYELDSSMRVLNFSVFTFMRASLYSLKCPSSILFKKLSREEIHSVKIETKNK